MSEGFEETTTSAADIMNSLDSHGSGLVVKDHQGLRPLAGRAVVEEIASRKSIIIMLGESDNDRRWYRGRVLALGPPGRTPRNLHADGTWHGGAEVPWGVSVGDEILFEPHLCLDAIRTFEFFGVKGRVWVVGQEEVLAAVEAT